MANFETVPLPIYSESATFQVERQLETTRFACDLTKCKGACCTMPAAAGAPILQSEIQELERVFPFVEKYLQPEAREVIAEKGIWQKDADGSLTIPAIAGRDCIFVMYDGDIALCAIEKAHRDGEISGFPKPISCHLFPIRIYPLNENGSYYICYEEIDECKGGRTRGKKEKIPLMDFLETPMIRALGEERVMRLRKALMD
jgi:hypothetical protein